MTQPTTTSSESTESPRGRKFGFLTWRGMADSAIFPLVDIAIVWASTILAYFLRFQGVVPDDFLANVVPVALIASILFVVLFYMFRLYHHVWRYAGVEVVIKLAAAVSVAFVVMAAVDVLVTPAGEVRPAPLGTLFIMSAFVLMGAGAIRLTARISSYRQSQTGGPERRNVIIIGAGDAGSLLLRDIEQHPEQGMRVVGFVDDDQHLHNRLIHGVRVLGAIDSLPSVVAALGAVEALIAIPTATSSDRRRILDLCSQAGVRARIVATSVSANVSDLRRVEVEDLLGRDPVPIDLDDLRRLIEDKVVAVTGAAGSIGAELCRQIVRLQPKRLHLIEIDETRLYEVYLELLEIGGTEPLMQICDIRDDRKLNELFTSDPPNIVIHAAAYKHVPLMEIAPDEAVKTNVGGTRNVLMASEAAGVERFVLISTDKAVAPSTVMGLTKAIAERMTLEACRRGLPAVAVRFGNVLGSRGSVVPLFEEQLRRGGPLRVTHPEVTRFFMTIPEAARLVLQAAALSDGGDIFVLEMGEPVRIVELAEKMITLSGAEAKIEFTGLRPAEKLHEVLVEATEELLPTEHEKISRVSAVPLPQPRLDDVVQRLAMFARLNDRVGIAAGLAALMPEFAGVERVIPVESGASVGVGLDPEMETLL